MGGGCMEDLLSDLAAILDYITDGQRRYVQALIDAKGDRAAAAKSLGCGAGQLRKMVSRARRRAAKQGVAPSHDMTRPAAPGFYVKGTSTYYPPTDSTPAQWVKTNKEREDQLEDFVEAFRDVAEGFKGLAPPVKCPDVSSLSDDLLCIYPMGDPHLGMYAWDEETRDGNFDLRIAERELELYVDMLVDMAPPAKTGLIISLGDFFHAHDDSARTKASGHDLDVDGRTSKVFQTGADLVMRLIERALRKHEHVIFDSRIGNHDDFLAVALAMVVAASFSKNERVTVKPTSHMFFWHEFGANLIGATHGHTAKPEKIRDAMVCDQAAQWGRTMYRHVYVGHYHHNSRRDLAGVSIEYMRNTAPRDVYATAGGWRSRNDMRVDIWHRENGPIGSWSVPRELVRAARLSEG